MSDPVWHGTITRDESTWKFQQGRSMMSCVLRLPSGGIDVVYGVDKADTLDQARKRLERHIALAATKALTK